VIGLAPRAPGDSVRPRRLSAVVVRPLNFTVSRQMRTRDLTNHEGILTGFIVRNTLLPRRTVSRIVDAIPGAKLLRLQKRFARSGRDDFCEFVVDGKTFLVIEPFGDNDQFWVVAEPPAKECPQLAKVRDAFQRHGVLFGLFAG